MKETNYLPIVWMLAAWICSKTKPTDISDTDQNDGLLSIRRKLRCPPAILFLSIVILSDLVKSFVFANTWIGSKHSAIPRQQFEAGRKSVKKHRTGWQNVTDCLLPDWGEMITGHRTDEGQDTHTARLWCGLWMTAVASHLQFHPGSSLLFLSFRQIRRHLF